jgi:prepilin-type N-terminal cleavage/methylation domain-containing protein
MEIEMKQRLKKSGFSLTEVLIAVGILAVAMLFIAGVFPVAIRFSTIATERTIAAIIADEAFVKLKIYAKGDLSDENDNIDFSQLKTYSQESRLAAKDLAELKDIFPAIINPNPIIYPDEFVYPTTGGSVAGKQYSWWALFRLTEDDTSDANSPVQVTVFICRKSGRSMKYRTDDGNNNADWPIPIKVGVSQGNENNQLQITNSGEYEYINDGYTIVDNATGRIYRVLERFKDTDDDTILLDRDWNDEDWQGGSNAPDYVWVVPPGVGGARGPCIAVYQKVMLF